MGRYFNWESRGPESPLSSGLDSLERGLERRRQLMEQERQRSLMEAPYTPEEIRAREYLSGRPVYAQEATGHIPGEGTFGSSGFAPPSQFSGVTAGAQPEAPIWEGSQPMFKQREMSAEEVLGKLSPQGMQRVSSMFVKQADTPEDRMARALAGIEGRKEVARITQHAASSRLVATLDLKEAIAASRLELDQNIENRRAGDSAARIEQGRKKLELLERQVELAAERFQYIKQNGESKTGELAEAEQNLKALQEQFKAIVGTFVNPNAPKVLEAKKQVEQGAAKVRAAKEKAKSAPPSSTKVESGGATPVQKYSPPTGNAPPVNTQTGIQEPASPAAVESQMVPPGYRLLRNKKTGETRLVKE